MFGVQASASEKCPLFERQIHENVYSRRMKPAIFLLAHKPNPDSSLPLSFSASLIHILSSGHPRRAYSIPTLSALHSHGIHPVSNPIRTHCARKAIARHMRHPHGISSHSCGIPPESPTPRLQGNRIAFAQYPTASVPICTHLRSIPLAPPILHLPDIHPACARVLDTPFSPQNCA